MTLNFDQANKKHRNFTFAGRGGNMTTFCYVSVLLSY